MGLRRLDSLSWGVVALMCATLGLAPFNPPHVVEKLGMLCAGGALAGDRLVRPA